MAAKLSSCGISSMRDSQCGHHDARIPHHRINHDDLAVGSGKAGLTFETTNDVLYKHIWNDTKTNVGGLEVL